MTLDALGWSRQRQKDFAPHAAEGLLPGRVVGEHRSHYRVATEATELSAQITGRSRNTAAQRSDLPGVGDFVAVRIAMGEGPAIIEAVLPRTSALVRKAAGERRPQLLAANIDVVFIVTAPDRDFNLSRLERYLALVQESGAAPVIVVNKSDLTNDVIGTTGQFAANELLGRAAQATQEVRAHGTPRSRPLSLPGLKSFETSLLYVVLTYWLASPSRRWRYSFWRSSIRCPCVPKAAG